MTTLATKDSGAIQKIEKFSSDIACLLKRFRSSEIDSELECNDDLHLVKNLKDLADQIEFTRKEVIYDSRQFIAKMNDGAKALISQLDDLEQAISSKILGWMYRLEKDASETKEKAVALSNKLNIPISVLSVDKISIRSEHMTVTKKTALEHEVTDESTVPREYLSVDEEKVKKAIKAGIRHIEGVKIFENETVQFRRR